MTVEPRLRRRLPGIIVTLGALLVVSLSPLPNTRSAYVTTKTTGMTARTPHLVPVGLATPKATAPQAFSVTGLAPGGGADHLVNIRNDGTASVPGIDLSVTTSSATLLDTDATNGLTVQVSLCSLVWQQNADGQPATCAGTATTLLGPGPLATLKAAAARWSTGLATLASNGIDHLRVRFGLPGTAPGGYAALTSTPTFTIWGVTVPTAPGAPTMNPGDRQMAVTWSAPSDGGSPITGYTVTLSSGATCTTATTSCMFTGLTNGVAYSATMTASNSFGTSAASASASEIPYPAALAMAAGKVEFWLDASSPSRVLTAGGTVATAGQSVQTWNDRSGNGHHVSQAVPANQMTVGTLNGRQALVSTNTLTIATFYNSATTATLQTVVGVATASATQTRLQILLATPANVNGVTARIFQRRLGSSSGALNGNDWAITGTSWTNSIEPTVPGPIANGTGIYVAQQGAPAATTFSISGSFSSRSMDGPIGEVLGLNTVFTAGERRDVEEYLARKWAVTIAPDSPTTVTATAGPAQATVSWTAPAGWNGGAALTGYTATASPGGATCTTTTTSCAINGLTAGTPYTVTVAATNSVGNSVSSTASSAVTPV